MPHFGSRVIGTENFQRAKALEDATSNLHFGGRVVDPPAPVSAAAAGRSVREALDALKKGEDVDTLAREELARPEGVRKTVARALLAAAAERGGTPDLLDKVIHAANDTAEV